jgi:tripartite-type tricarboxylate transporter receptor subunit TctC
MNRRKILTQGLATLSAIYAPSFVKAQSFPTKPVTLIVASAPGGPLDAAARLVAQHLTGVWGQSVVVDHKAGAGGTIAAAALARATADGHTLMLSTRAVVINPSLYDKLPFETLSDIAPVAMVNEQPNVLGVPTTLSVQTLSELLNLVRKNPGVHSFGSPGNGGIPHIAGEMFMRSTGTKLIHVPYKGAGPLMNDLLAGRIDMTFGSPGTFVAHMKDGKIIPLAVASPKRSPLMPEVPTFAELGVQDVNITSWYGLFAPGKTPINVLSRINTDITAFLRTPEGAKRILAQGAHPTPLSLDEFSAEFKRDLSSFPALVKTLGLKPA